jgi:hypothetical protein
VIVDNDTMRTIRRLIHTMAYIGIINRKKEELKDYRFHHFLHKDDCIRLYHDETRVRKTGEPEYEKDEFVWPSQLILQFKP